MAEGMEELGKEMIKYCGGLPLAILVLGGILANKKTLMDWRNVHENIKSYMGEENKIGQDHKGLNNILALSYNDLPYQLKPCFLYLSMYKEDAHIETESLYQIWMAEGMICTDDRIGEEPIMDVAERYLEELSKRSIVFVEVNKRISNNRFESCRIQDLIRDMCLEKAKDENFLKLIDRPHVNKTIDQNDQLVDSSNIFFNTGRFNRRLAVHLHSEDVEIYVPPQNELTQQLRSFVIYGKSIIERGGTMKPVFARYKMLRVLSITNVRGPKGISFSQAIGNLIYLRYLSLRDSEVFRSLPSYISKLYHLETLDLRTTYIKRMSKALRKLGRLKHLYLPFPHEPDCKVRLDGLHNLEILENFDSRRCEVKALSTLTNLRSLKAYVWRELEEFIKQVKYLRCLRCLSLFIIEMRVDSEKKLREMFYQSPLKVLEIQFGWLSKLPEYEPYFLPHVHTLALYQTRIQEDPMSTLEKLPNLRRLILGYEAFVGNEMICHANGFLQLKSFVIASLHQLNNIRIEKAAMPNLSQLRIENCRNLKMVPDRLRLISTLTELEFRRMPDEFNARLQIKDGRQGEDFDKVRHVPSITFSE